MMSQDREEALKEYDYLLGVNKQDRNVDSISRLGFWAKDNEMVIRKALEAKEPELKFPEHKASLHLIHNQHKDYYMTVEDCVSAEEHGYVDWVNEEQKQKAIETNDCWYIQVYPETPIGFYLMAAADLNVLLDSIKDGE